MGDKSLLTAQEEARLADLRRQAAIDYNALTQEQLKMMDELQEKEKGIVDSSERRIESLNRANELLAIQIERNEILIEQGQTVVGHYETKLEQQKNSLLIDKENLDITTAAGKAELKRLDAELQALDAKKKGYADSENFAKRFMGITREPSSEFGKFLVDPAARLEGLSAGLGETIDGMSILTSTVDKVVEATMALAIEQDAAVSSFRMATGATSDFDTDIVRLEHDLRTAGVTSAEAAEAVQNLYVNVSGFSQMAPEAREEMSKMVAVLAEVGVAAADSTKNIQIAIKGLGMSNTEATALQSELRSFAQGINVSTAQMAKDFATMGPQIAAMGDKGVAAFESLQVTMKETGLEMATVLKLVEQFDTFDGAGKQVGKLNALMGGPFLNTLELVSETDLGARMEKLRDGVMDAGVSFDSLSYYQKKAYASALGLNGEMELAMFLGNNMDQIIPEQKTGKELEELAKETAEFKDVMEELRQVGVSFALTMRPVVAILKGLFNIIQILAPYIGTLTLMIGGYIIATDGAAIATAFLNSNLIMNTLVKLEAIGATSILNIFNWLLATSFTAVGFAARFSMGWIGLLAGAVLALAGYFWTKTHSPGLITILGAVAAGFIAMGIAASIFGFSLGPVLPFILAFAAAMLMIGAGIGIAAAGMALFVSSINAIGTGLAASMLATALAIRQIVDAIEDIPMTKTLALTAAILPLAAMAPIATVAAAGVGAVTRGLGGSSSAGAGAAGASGPAPIINVHLSVDGTEFATAVNKVEVEKYTGGTASDMHATITNMIAEGLLKRS